MKQVIAKVIAWIMAYQTLPTAAEQIDGVLAAFTGMVEKLDAAIAQATDEIDASFERQDEAYEAYGAVRAQEQAVRDTTIRAQDRAMTARDRIAALTGGAA